MRIIAISDTHEQHHHLYDLYNESADVIICAGDVANHRNPGLNEPKMHDFLEWFNSLPMAHKIFVPGNHDTSIEKGMINFNSYPEITFLIHDTYEIPTVGRTIKIFGSPFTPSFGQGWAYNIPRHKIEVYWKDIPRDTDILVTHGPPKGILDSTTDRYSGKIDNVGDKALLNKVIDIQPKYHIFGHLHDEKGIWNHGTKTIRQSKCKTTFINPSIVNLHHEPVNKPIYFEI